jgi:hypothetical protein
LLHTLFWGHDLRTIQAYYKHANRDNVILILTTLHLIPIMVVIRLKKGSEKVSKGEFGDRLLYGTPVLKKRQRSKQTFDCEGQARQFVDKSNRIVKKPYRARKMGVMLKDICFTWRYFLGCYRLVIVLYS